MTNPSKNMAENESPQRSSQPLQIELSVNHKATVVESGNADMLSDNCGEHTHAPSVLASELPTVLSERERTALFQKRQDEFPARRARLEELSKVRDDREAVARKYQTDHQLLCDDLEFIWQILVDTLDDPSDGIHHSVDSHEWVLRHSALALDGLENVIHILQAVVQLPIQTNVLRQIKASLDYIRDPEGKYHSEWETDQHWAEVDLAESGLWPLKEQVENLNAFIKLGRKPLQRQPEKKDLVDFTEIHRRLKQQRRNVELKTIKNLARKKILQWGPPAAKGSHGTYLFEWRVISPILESHFEISFCDYS